VAAKAADDVKLEIALLSPLLVIRTTTATARSARSISGISLFLRSSISPFSFLGAQIDGPNLPMYT
jgi:hypothetical protein